MIMEKRSSLELMLERIQQVEDQPEDVPPALPTRPVTRGRLPRSRRKLQFTFQRSDCEENGSLNRASSLEESTLTSKTIDAHNDLGSEVHEQESAEVTGVAASALEIKSAEETIEGYDCRNNLTGVFGKISSTDDREELLLEGMLVTQRQLQGCQDCSFCQELIRGVISLQSLIRGENARKAYMRNMSAIAVIQKHVRCHLRNRILDEQDQAVICSETRSQGWLAWKYLNSIDKKGKQLNENTRSARNPEKMDCEMKDQIQIPYAVLVDLRRQILKTEALLDKKKEENSLLHLRIKQLERRREQYEAKMKSMEKMWQDQLTSIQTNLAASQRNSASKNATGKLRHLLALPETHDECPDDASPSPRTTEIVSLNSGRHFPDHQNGVLTNNAGVILEVESGQVTSNKNSAENLLKLKVNFKAWKKDFKIKLMEAKTTMKKLGSGNSGTRKRSRRKWWRNMEKEEAQSRSIVLCS